MTDFPSAPATPEELLKIIDERQPAKEPLIMLPDDEAMVLGEHVRVEWLGPHQLEAGMIILQPGSSVPVSMLMAVEHHPASPMTADHILTDTRPQARYSISFENDDGKFGGVLRETDEIRVLGEKISA